MTRLLVACVAQFLVVLDVSVVNVALPSIQEDLGFSPTNLQWVVNAYVLIFASFLLLGGRLADLMGVKRAILIGFSLFTAASLVGGMAGTPLVLSLARAFQGLGAAILAPASLTLLTTGFAEGAGRNRALALWSAFAVAGGAAGSMVGGLLTQLLSWHWVLLINVPVGIVAIPVAARYVMQPRVEKARPKLDAPGAVLAMLGFGALVYGITLIETHGLADRQTQLMLLGAFLVLGVFVWVEARVAAEPIVPLRLFRRRSIVIGNAAMLLAGAGLFPMWYFLSLLMQNVLGMGPLETGVGFLPHTIVTIAASVRLTPWLMDRIAHRRLVMGGALIASAGFFWQGSVNPADGYVVAILLPGVVFAFGSGLMTTPLTNIVTAGVPAADAGAASGVMNTARQLGGAIGLAIFVALVAGSSGVATSAHAYAPAFHAIALVLIVVAGASLILPGRPKERNRQA